MSRQKRFTECRGKVGFDSALLANQVARERKRVSRRSAYRCQRCGKWHLGEQKRTAHMNLKRQWLIADASDDFDEGAMA
jgi:hypothetical protein